MAKQAPATNLSIKTTKRIILGNGTNRDGRSGEVARRGASRTGSGYVQKELLFLVKRTSTGQSLSMELALGLTRTDSCRIASNFAEPPLDNGKHLLGQTIIEMELCREQIALRWVASGTIFFSGSNAWSLFCVADDVRAESRFQIPNSRHLDCRIRYGEYGEVCCGKVRNITTG